MVDDESSVGQISELQFRKAIKDGAISFHYFEDADKCLNYLNQECTSPSDTVVLTDISMPDITGLELLQTIKETFPEMEVFMMSAYSDQKIIKQSLELGARGYFTKPVNYKVIKSKIEEDYGVVL
ncbi:MAG: response regulator [Bdellovibrio sp.]|nr:response regulator [Bdellovibrio sp.]